MENIAHQVQQQVASARTELERLLRTPFDREQVEQLRASGEKPKCIDILYPLIAASYPPAVRSLLEKPVRIKWLACELGKLDPTAYCLYLPEPLYAKVRPSLPELPATPTSEQELAYTAAFINALAAEDCTSYAYASAYAYRADSPEVELRRWQNLLRQIEQITKVLHNIQQQLSPMGRALHRLRSSTS